MNKKSPAQLRQQAEKSLAKGMLTENYLAKVDEVIAHLNSAFATEIICSLRYKDHHYKAKRLGLEDVADHFLAHSQQEQEHADTILNRISQLKGTPDMNPAAIIANSHVDYVKCETLCEMIEENLIAERIAVNVYRDFVQYLSMNDPVTRAIIEGILAVEEEHADDMLELKQQYCHNDSN